MNIVTCPDFGDYNIQSPKFVPFMSEGDKKAFFEASQWTMKQNKETIELMKEENKHFREALAVLQKVMLNSAPNNC